MPDQIPENQPSKLTRRSLITANLPPLPVPENRTIPVAHNTVRLSTTAMACEFTVMLNPLPHEKIWQISEILDSVHELESQYTVYRDSSELMNLNASAGLAPFTVKQNLFDLLKKSVDIAHSSFGTYNPLTHPLILLWRTARAEKRIPSPQEISQALAICNIHDITFDPANSSIYLQQSGMGFNLGSIGKGYAIDHLAQQLITAGISDFLIHAGQSSVYAAGNHGPYTGWPVGISHPNLANRFLGTFLLHNQAMSTSGSGVQFYRVEGKKYGHILDPRTGMPADSSLSSTIFHPSAAIADALSTAAYVAGPTLIENLLNSFPDTTYILLSPTSNPHQFEILSHGLPTDKMFWHQ